MKSQTSKVLTLATIGLMALGSAAFAQTSNNLPAPGSTPGADVPVLNAGRVNPAAEGDLLFASRYKPAASFSAHLTASQVNPPNRSGKAGNVLVELNPERNQLTFKIRLSSFDSPIQAIRIRKGAVGSEGMVLKQFALGEGGMQTSLNVGSPTLNGPNRSIEVTPRVSGQTTITRDKGMTTETGMSSISDILSAAPAQTDVSFTWTATDKEYSLNQSIVDDLVNGRLYVDVVTAAFPAGEIRGQLTNANNNMTGQGVSAH